MDDHLAQEQAIDLREYLAVLRNRKWTILLVLLLVVASALAFSFRQTPIYQSTTRLLVKGVPTDGSGYVQPPNLETEAEILASEPIATRVIEELDLPLTPDASIAQLTVTPAAETALVLELSYSSTDPETARDAPNSYASSYIDYKRDKAQEALELGRQAVENQLTPVQEQLDAVTRRLGAPGVGTDDALRSTLETERAALIAQLGVLEQRVDDFELSIPIDLAGGEVIQPAALPTSPTSPDHVKNGLLAVFLGLMLGIGLAFLRERLDDRLRGRGDIERALNAPVLATIPRVQTNKKANTELVTRSQPRSSASEAYRSLRTNLQFLMTQQSVRSVLVTSPSAGEGKTMTCGNLATVLTQAGQRVILVSCDLRRPTLERYFNVETQPGLSNWLAEGDDEIWEFVKDPGIANLRIIPSGPIPGNPAELLTSRRLRTLVDTLESNCDLVLIDSPPSLAVADASILASHVDGVLLVLNATTTHRSAAARAKEELERVGASLLGCVYNAHDASSSPYYYQPYYSSGYTDEIHPQSVKSGG